MIMNNLRRNATLFLSRLALSCLIAPLLLPRLLHAQELSPQARKHFTAARQAQEANSLDKAADEYAATIVLAPNFVGAYVNLGLVRYVQGHFSDSATALTKALHFDSKLIGANLYLGIDELKMNHPEKALPLLRRVATLDPSNKDAQSWLGTAYWQDGQTWAALEQLRETDRRFPNDPDILFVLGEAYRKTADQEIQAVVAQASGTAYVHQIFGDIYLDQHALAKAAGHYQRALQEDPKASDIFFDLGEVALLSGQTDEAETEYRKQLAVTPNAAATKARLGEVALLKNKVPEALQLFSDAIAVSPLETVAALQLPPSFANTAWTFPEGLLVQLRTALPALKSSSESAARNLALATTFARIGQLDEFQNAFEQFESAIPHQAPAPELRGRAMQDVDRQSFEEAEAEIHDYLKTHSQDLPGQCLAARIHRLLSLSILNRLLSSYPDSYRSHQLLAQTYEQRDEDEKAVAEYKKVEEASPTLPGVHYALGHLLMKDGDLEQATVQLKEELRLDPDQPEANAEMGMALLSQNESTAAIEYLKKALALQPDLYTAHEQLGKAFYLARNYEGARKELTTALADDPEGIAHYQLGLVYKALGRTEDANREFDASARSSQIGLRR